MSRSSSQAAPALFGTDGIRAPSGSYPLDRDTVITLGCLIAESLAREGFGSRVILGGDTRASTPEICAWLAAGLRAGGAEPLFGGVVTTPAVAFLTRSLGAAAGIAVSASHNRYPDNGIKLFTAQGFKWSPGAERDLEEALAARAAPCRATATSLSPDRSLLDRYLDSLVASLPDGASLNGLRVAMDSAHGAAAPCASRLFDRLGAEVVPLFESPDGVNINDGCGSTHPEGMARATVDHGCHLGVSFDGDADRMVVADEKGSVRDGDAILYLWARELAGRGELVPTRVVATTMSNLGLERALSAEGIDLVRCDVGDREVVGTMRREGIRLGGEQSGHIVHLGFGTTGDGMLTALQLAHLLVTAGRPLSEWLEGFQRLPQVLRNVPVRRKPDLRSVPGVAAAAREVEARLGDEGRLVLRYSGTEPLARIMIEGPELAAIDAMAQALADSILHELGSD